MNTQEAFDLVLAHLWDQNAVSFDTDICRYHDDVTGNKCAIGCIIPLEAYDSDMEGLLVSQLLYRYPDLLNLPAFKALNVGHQYPLFVALQELHDSLVDTQPEDFQDALRTGARDLAQTYDLNLNLPE